MAAVDGAQISPALERFLDAPEDAPVEEDEQQEPSGDLSLGDLDITSSQVSIKGGTAQAATTTLGGTISSCSERPPACTCAGLEEQIQHFADSDVLRAILDQGCDPREYERQYEGQLREAEQGSVQDYIAESENLVMLHDQVWVWGATSSTNAPKTALRRSRAMHRNVKHSASLKVLPKLSLQESKSVNDLSTGKQKESLIILT